MGQHVASGFVAFDTHMAGNCALLLCMENPTTIRVYNRVENPICGHIERHWYVDVIGL